MRHLKRDALFSQCSLGPHNALSNSGFRNQKCARHFLGRQASEQAQRKRHSPLGRKHRMTSSKHQPEKVVANVIVESRFEVRHGHLFLFQFASEFCVFTFQPGVAAEVINGSMFSSSHEPSARIIRNARLRPLLKRRHQSILREILGNANIAHNAHQASDQPRRLDSPDRVNRAMDRREVFIAMWIGSRHSYRSHHLYLLLAREVARTKHLPNLSLAFPSWPMFLMQLHEANRPLHRFLLGRQLELREAADDFLGFGERPVGHRHLPAREPHSRTLRRIAKSSIAQHGAGLDCLFRKLRNRIHQWFGRKPLSLFVFNNHHEFHGCISFKFGLSSLLDGAGRPNVGSIYTSNEHQKNRQVKNFYRAAFTVFFGAVFAFIFSLCFLTTGFGSRPKSATSKTWRISISYSPSWQSGQRLTHSTASSIDLSCQIQYPAISSLVSVNGPSITVRLSPAKRTRLPFELGWRPSAASRTPAFTNSSLNFPISSHIFCLGMIPASESFVALTMTMNRIVMSPFELGRIGLRRSAPYNNVEPQALGSTKVCIFVHGSQSPSPVHFCRNRIVPAITSSNGHDNTNRCSTRPCRNRC